MAETEKRKSNYEVTKIEMRERFLSYDQEEMIRKFALKHDEQYLYLRLMGRDYMIHRKDGSVTWTDENHPDPMDAGFNEVMPIYDVLCYSQPDCHLSGEFVNMRSLTTIQGGRPGNDMFNRMGQKLDHKDAALSKACEKLGGFKVGKGDVGYELPLFDFLPVWIQFWNSDDEYPASLQLFWDKNVLQYMHFETVAFVAGHVVARLTEETAAAEAAGE